MAKARPAGAAMIRPAFRRAFRSAPSGALGLAVLFLDGCAAGRAAPAAHRENQVATGFVTRSLNLDGVPHAFQVFVPPEYDAGRRWPCVLFLHGAGECGSDGEKPTRVGLGPAIRAQPAAWPAIVIFPQKPSDQIEWWECEALVFATLAAVQRENNIDAARVALTGLSQGGHGTWMLGARHPQRWSRLAPVCGYGRPRTIAPRVAGLPIWAFHGERDDVVPPAETQAIVAAVRAEQTRRTPAVTPVQMTLFPEANHNSWDAAYGMPALRAWLLGDAVAPAGASPSGP